MSINHYSSDVPEAIWWWKQQHSMMESSRKASSPKQNNSISRSTPFWASNPQFYHSNNTNTTPAAYSFNLNNNEDDEELDEQLTDDREKEEQAEEPFSRETEIIPKEPLFEKPLTPSDVGKLNRLVIPKQHAEKYFPLGGGDSGDKGLLLSFEDESGKCWRFRYSYWNSSQSYVLTKGWSRFVKEKKLDAGDIVLFERHLLDGGRLFIGWRRRTAASPAAATAPDSGAAVASGVGGGWTQVLYSSGHAYPTHTQLQQGHGPAASLTYQPDCLHAGGRVLQQKQTNGGGNSKRLRLFGVNLECQSEESSEPATPEGSSISIQGQAQCQYQYYPSTAANYNHHNHMDFNFSRDVNQMRYHQG